MSKGFKSTSCSQCLKYPNPKPKTMSYIIFHFLTKVNGYSQFKLQFYTFNKHTMKNLKSIFLLLVITVNAQMIISQSVQENEQVKERIDSYLTEGVTNGLSGAVLVYRKGKLILNKGYNMSIQPGFHFLLKMKVFYWTCYIKKETKLFYINLPCFFRALAI